MTAGLLLYRELGTARVRSCAKRSSSNGISEKSAWVPASRQHMPKVILRSSGMFMEPGCARGDYAHKKAFFLPDKKRNVLPSLPTPVPVALLLAILFYPLCPKPAPQPCTCRRIPSPCGTIGICALFFPGSTGSAGQSSPCNGNSLPCSSLTPSTAASGRRRYSAGSNLAFESAASPIPSAGEIAPRLRECCNKRRSRRPYR